MQCLHWPPLLRDASVRLYQACLTRKEAVSPQGPSGARALPISSGAERFLHRRLGIAALEGGHALEPAVEHIGILLQPVARRLVRLDLVVEDGAHDLVFHLQAELEVLEELADVRALIEIAGANVGVDSRAAEVRA